MLTLRIKYANGYGAVFEYGEGIEEFEKCMNDLRKMLEESDKMPIVYYKVVFKDME